MASSTRLTDEEEKLARSYAALTGASVEGAFKKALFERIDDEYDIVLGEAAYHRYLDDPKTYSFDEVLKMFGDDE